MSILIFHKAAAAAAPELIHFKVLPPNNKILPLTYLRRNFGFARNHANLINSSQMMKFVKMHAKGNRRAVDALQSKHIYHV